MVPIPSKDPLPEAFRPMACDVMKPDCPARALLATLADKWSLLLVHALSEGTFRTGALRRRIGGISEKVLIETLRRLEAAEIVRRTEFAEVPPRVEYSLTAQGRALGSIVTALDQWVEQHTSMSLEQDATAGLPNT